MMAKVDGFLDSLITFDKENIDKVNLEEVQKKYLSDPNLTRILYDPNLPLRLVCALG